MSGELKDTLKKRLDENYNAFIESLQEKPTSELISMAPEITAAQQLHEELLDACDDEDVGFLLRFDDPLEVVRGYWESEISGYDHSGEMGHMLWDIRDRELYEKEQLAPEEALPRPKMQLSEKEQKSIGQRKGGNPKMSDNTVKQIAADDLRHMEGQEGLVLQGCGGSPQEWVDGINNMLTEEGILLNGSLFKLEDVSLFQHGELTCLLFPFDDVKLDVGRLAMWRIQTHGQFGGTWLSDFVVAKSAPSVSAYGENSVRSLAPPLPTQPASLGLREVPGPNRLGGFLHQPPRQKPTMSLTGMDGNIFSVMGKASVLLKEAGMGDLVSHMVQRVTTCGDYNKALNIISEYVETELSPPATPQKSTKKKVRNTHER